MAATELTESTYRRRTRPVRDGKTSARGSSSSPKLPKLFYDDRGLTIAKGHTVSQRLRKLKQIPAELIPLGKYRPARLWPDTTSKLTTCPQPLSSASLSSPPATRASGNSSSTRTCDCPGRDPLAELSTKNCQTIQGTRQQFFFTLSRRADYCISSERKTGTQLHNLILSIQLPTSTRAVSTPIAPDTTRASRNAIAMQNAKEVEVKS